MNEIHFHLLPVSRPASLMPGINAGGHTDNGFCNAVHRNACISSVIGMACRCRPLRGCRVHWRSIRHESISRKLVDPEPEKDQVSSGF